MENEIKHSEDFITRKSGKQSGFSIPSDYFDDVEQDIITDHSLPDLS